MENISERLRKVILLLGIKQNEFAKNLGLTPAAISRQLNGINKIEKVNALAIEAVYGVNHNWLLTGDGDMFLPGKDQRAGHHQELSPQHISSEPQAPDLHAEYTQRMQVIDGSVQEYPDIMSIEQIYRTRWYKKLPGEAQFVINALDELHDPEVLKALERICNNAVVRQRADEQLFADLEFLKQKAMGKLYKKGEAG